MIRFYFFLFLAALGFSSFSQVTPPSFSWEYSFANGITIKEHVSDTNGNIYFCGYIAGTFDFDFGSGVSSWTTPINGGNNTEDGFLAKYSPSGQLIWKVIFSGIGHEEINDLTIDASGNAFVWGTNMSTSVDLDPSGSSYYLPSAGNFIAKYSTNGQFLWANRLDIQMGWQNTQGNSAMAIDKTNQDLIIAGGFYNTIDIDPSAAVYNLIGAVGTDATLFLARFNTNGQLVWASDFDGTDVSGSVNGHNVHLAQITTDFLGNIFFIGEIDGTVDLNPTAGIDTISNRNFIAKFNSSGQHIMAQRFHANVTLLTFDIDSQNNLGIGGRFFDIVDFDLGAGIQTLDAGVSSGDFFVAKYTNTMGYITAFTHGNTPFTFSEVNSLFFDALDNIIVCGYYDLYQSASDFDPGPGTYMVPVDNASFIAKYNVSGNLIKFGSINNSVVGFYKMYMNRALEKLVIVGGSANSSGPVDFDPGSGSFIDNINQHELVIARYSLDCISSTTQTTSTICYGDTLYVGGQKLFTTGYHSAMTQAINGCDSTVAINLTVYPQNVNNLNISICSTQSYFFNGVNLNATGLYHDTLVDARGCDSLVNLNLTVIPVNDNVTLSGNVLTSSESLATAYQWYNCSTSAIISGATGVSCSANTTGNYAVIISKGGCVDTTSCQMVITGSTSPAPSNLWGNQYQTLNAEFYKVDKKGNSYVFGSYLPEQDLDPDTAVFTPPYNIEGIYMLKYSTTGAFVWAKWIETNISMYVFDVDVDTTGAVYISGSYNGSFDADAGSGVTQLTSLGAEDIFLMKYSTAGNFEWAKSIGATGYNNPTSITLDKQNNIYMVGSFGEDLDFDTGPGTQIISSMGGTAFNFIVKYNSVGNYISGISIDNQITVDRVAVDNNNNIVYSGSYWGLTDIYPGPTDMFVDDLSSGTQQNAFIVKLDQNYNFLNGIGIPSDMLLQISDLTTDNAGNVLAVGNMRSSVHDFNPSPTVSYTLNYTNSGNYDDDMFLVKFNPTLNFLWATSVGNTNADYPRTISIDNSNSVYVLAQYENTLDADGTQGVLYLTGQGLTDTYVERYDSLGNFNWAFRMGSIDHDTPIGMGLDQYNNVYACGNSNGTTAFKQQGANQVASVSNGVFVAKYGTCPLYVSSVTNNGSFFTANDLTGPYQWYNCATNLPIFGATSQNFYPITNGQYKVLIGNANCAVSSTCFSYLSTLILEAESQNELSVFPNPVEDIVHVFFSGNFDTKNSLMLYNNLGELLYTAELIDNTAKIDLSNLSRGVYFLKLEGYNGALVKKMIKQ